MSARIARIVPGERKQLGEIVATTDTSITLAKRMGLPWRAPTLIAFRCSDCRLARTDGLGQLMGVAVTADVLDQDKGSSSGSRWFWVQARKRSMFVFPEADDGDMRVRLAGEGEVITRRQTLEKLVDLEVETMVKMSCRVANHPPRPKLSPWIRSRAVKALDDGYHSVHV